MEVSRTCPASASDEVFIARAAAVPAASLARRRAVLLGVDARVLHLGTDPVRRLKVALALGGDPLLQLVLHLFRQRRERHDACARAVSGADLHERVLTKE